MGRFHLHRPSHDEPLGQNAKPEDAARLGDFVQLSAQAAHDIPRCERVVVPECGHIPHLETPDQFLAQFLPSSPAEEDVEGEEAEAMSRRIRTEFEQA